MTNKKPICLKCKNELLVYDTVEDENVILENPLIYNADCSKCGKRHIIRFEITKVELSEYE